MSAGTHKKCAGVRCSNSAPKKHKLCGPCRAHQEHEDARERFFSGLAVPASTRADIQETDEADACFEGYKWALRDGIGQDTAMDIGEFAAEEVKNWYRREKRAATLDARMRALKRIRGSETDRREALAESPSDRLRCGDLDGDGAILPVDPEPTKPQRRRVTTTDLLDAGLLDAGASLSMQRHGQKYLAVVHSDGQIETADGERFKTPSRAAQHAVGSRSENGWAVWHTDDGKPISYLWWEFKVQEFSAEGRSARQQAEMRRVVGAWVNHRLSRKEAPDVRDDDAVLAWLKAQKYAASTIAAYQNHLDRWFDLHSAK